MVEIISTKKHLHFDGRNERSQQSGPYWRGREEEKRHFLRRRNSGGIEKRDTDYAMWLQIFRGNCKPHVVAHTLASRGLQVNNFHSCAVVSRPNATSEFLEARTFKDRPFLPPLSTNRRCSRDTMRVPLSKPCRSSACRGVLFRYRIFSASPRRLTSEKN